MAKKLKKYYFHKNYLSERDSHETTISIYLLHLKDLSNKTTTVKWSILRCAPIWTKITYPDQKELLNKRSGISCKCCHVNKYL